MYLLADAEAKREDLQRQLSAVNSLQEDVGELAKSVEQETAIQHRREGREWV